MKKFFLILSSVLLIHPSITLSQSLTFDQAVQSYRTQVQKDPKNLEMHQKMIDYAAKANQIKVPLNVYQTAYEKQPNNPIVIYVLAYAYLANDQENKAFPLFQQCVTTNSSIWQAHLQLARYFKNHDKFSQAIVHYEKTRDLHPKSITYHFEMGQVYRRLGALDAAENAFLQAIDYDKFSAQAYYELGQVYALQKMADRAIEQYRKGKKLDPDNPVVRYQLAHIFIDNDDGRNAILALRSGMSADTQYSQVANRLKNVSSLQASSILKQILKAKPNNAYLQYFAGKLCNKIGETEQAIFHLKKAKLLNPTDANVRFLLGQLYEEQAKTQMAITEFEESAALGNAQLELLLELAKTYHRQNNQEEFMKIADQILAINEDQPEIHYQLSQYYDHQFQQKRREGSIEESEDLSKKAIEHADRAVKLAPDVAKYNLKLGEQYDRQGMLKAIRFYEKAIQLDPQNAEPYYRRGLFMSNFTFGSAKVLLYEPELVMEDLTHAVQLDPNSAGAHHALGVVYDRMGNVQQAMLEFNKVAELDPADSRPHLYLGEKYANNGQFQLAISSFAKVIKMDPSNVEALKDYAFLCLSHDQDRLWRDANKALESAIKIRPNDAEILMNYAYTLYLNNEFQRAVEYYQRSLEIRPNWEKTLYNLALVYERTGQKGLALQTYEKAIEIAPNSRQGIKALEKIKKLKGEN